MEWIAVDETLVAEGFNPAEQEAVAQGRAIDPAADPVPGICSGVAGRVRAALMACGRVQRLDAIARGGIPFAEDVAFRKPTFHGRPARWASPGVGGIMHGNPSES